MPVKVRTRDKWLAIHPTAAWQATSTTLDREKFDVGTDLIYINVDRK